MISAAELTGQLIDIPSVTGEEFAVANFLNQVLSDFVPVKKIPVAEKRFNILASESGIPEVILTSHMDTVAPFIPASIKNKRIYGRGACDAKGIIAAMIQAFIQMDEQFRKRTGLLFVVGEETDSIGARNLKSTGVIPRYFINGEPTGNKLVRAQKGTFMFRISVKGQASHSGYPEYGRSAIETLLDRLNELRNHPWPIDEFFGATTFNIGKISGGEAINTLASEASAQCCIRVVTDCDTIRKTLDAYKKADMDIKIISASEPMRLFCPDNYKETISVSYGSDAWYLQQIAPTLMVGPGSILDAHKPDESIGLDELEQAVSVYKKLIRDLLEKQGN